MPRHTARLLAAGAFLAVAAAAQAQQPADSPPPKPAEPGAKPAAPAAKPAAPAAKPDAPARVDSIRVEERRSTTTDRRDSTASKIVIGRDEIEQYGDTNLSDVLRRLPGVTQSGRPGRRGPIAFRGLGGGFTQILINGERIPPGFSIEDIAPEQVERIEILRAPTAETGTRAIAGTINIVLREALRKRMNDLKLGATHENGRTPLNGSFTRNDTFSETGSYNITISPTHRASRTESDTRNVFTDLPSGLVTRDQDIASRTVSDGDSVFATARLQWRLGPGEQFSLQPFVVSSRNDGVTDARLTQPVGLAPYETSHGRLKTTFESARFMTMLNRRLDPETTYELRGGAGRFTVDVDGRTEQFDRAGNRALLQTTVNDISDRSWNVAGKLARRWGETHTVSTGLEREQSTRGEKPLTIVNGVPQLAGFGAETDVTTKRSTAWLQDEWDPNPNWSTSLGVRWEEILTRSQDESAPVRNASRVVNPLAHLVWRFDAPKRDQLRLSLTQSYRPPPTQNLVARPRLNAQDPVPGPNEPTSADTAGNPGLKPEVANGLEFSFERYLKQNGVVSLNVFTRRIRDVIRSVTALETVSWSPAPRWVTRPQNFGRAQTSGVEFDTKFVLSDVVEGVPAVNVRANVSVFRSKVDDVPGPDNRLASQPGMTANVGGDYRFKGTPFAVGGALNWTPGYDTRLTFEQRESAGRKAAWDAYLLWHIDSATRLRLTLAGVVPRDAHTASSYELPDEFQQSRTVGRGYLTTGIRFEMRLCR
jgi:iron complex outermembrane receptor protein